MVKKWLSVALILLVLLAAGCAQSGETPSTSEIETPREPALEQTQPSGLAPEGQLGSSPKAPGADESVSGVPLYPGATVSAVPDDMKTAFGIPSDAICEGYTAAGSPEDVAGWYREQMSAWGLEYEGSFSPPDRPGMMVYTQQYKRAGESAFLVIQNAPGGQAFILIATGPWEMMQHLTMPGGESPPGQGQYGGGPPADEGTEQDGLYTELGYGAVTFTVSPVDLSYITEVEPLGNLNPSTGHTFPTDHGSLVLNGTREIRAPAGGVISEIQYKEAGDYRIVITHTNSFRSWFDHLATIEPSIMSQVEAVEGKIKPGQEVRVLNISVEPGQVIGTGPKGAVGIDWGVWDEEVTLSFIHPEKYGRMVHSVHFIPYCEPSLAEALLEKVPRTAEPRWGKIDFDQPEKLVGNWTLEDTGGEEPFGEWEKHLAFVYDWYEPTQIRIAVGGVLNVPGKGKVYQVVGNSPDPAEVTIDSGMVVYRLKGLPEWGETGITATIIVEMVDAEKIKVEGFPGHPSNPQFTTNARYYMR